MSELQTALADIIAEHGPYNDDRDDAYVEMVATRLASAFCPIVVLLDGTIMSEDWEPLYAFRPNRQHPNG